MTEKIWNRTDLYYRYRLVAVRQLNKFDGWWRPEQSLQRFVLEGQHYTLKLPLHTEKVKGCFQEW